MTNKEALEALDNIEDCISAILSCVYRCGVTELAKFKFNNDAEVIRKELEKGDVK